MTIQDLEKNLERATQELMAFNNGFLDAIKAHPDITTLYKRMDFLLAEVKTAENRLQTAQST